MGSPCGRLGKTGLALLVALGGCGESQDADQPARAPTLQQQAAPAEPPQEPVWPPVECDDVYDLRVFSPRSPNGAVTVSADSESFPNWTFDPPWGDAPVQAIALAPLISNQDVLADFSLYAGNALVAFWAPGDRATPPLPADVGIALPSGRLRLQMHYYNVGSGEQKDQSGISICIVRGTHLRPKVAAFTETFTVYDPLVAPANDRNHVATGRCKVTSTAPVTLLQVQPFARKLAKSVRFAVRKPDGSETVVVDRPFRSGESSTFPLDPPLVVETGDIVSTTCTFDNPTSKSVTQGEQVRFEACRNYALYFPRGALLCRDLRAAY